MVVKLSACVAVLDALSTARTVKLEVPAVVGVPLITPVDGFRLNPPGKDPELIDHVNGEVQPAVASLSEYGTPTVQGGTAEVVVIEHSRVTVRVPAVVSK